MTAVGGDASSFLNWNVDADPSERFAQLRVLLVGAGGIGSEVAHGLVQLGVGCLHIIDLDRIDASNLNRQFLFRRTDIGRLKSEAVVEHLTKSSFNRGTDLVAYASDIRDTQQFSWTFFRSFDIVLNALDNLEARQHVNKMCVATRVPLIDTGSAGYLGQTIPILPGISECYQCTPKPAPKQFAVCTIRSKPEKPAHCIAWAKHLYTHLFGPATNESLLTDLECRWDGQETPQSYTSRLLRFLFRDEIVRHAAMLEQAGDRRRPRPIEETLLSERVAPTPQVLEERMRLQTVVWDIGTCIETLKAVIPRLLRRADSRAFDKDDVDALVFVTAMSNLRAFCYHVEPLQSLFEVKGIAGDIVHAIAATNATVAGLAIMEVCKWHGLLDADRKIKDPTLARTALRCVFVLRTPTPSRHGSTLLLPEALAPPSAHCETCSRGKVAIQATRPLEEATLGQFIEECLRSELSIPADAQLSISLLSWDPHYRPRIALLYEDPDLNADDAAVAARADDDDDDDEQHLWRANRERFLPALGVHAPAELRIEALQRVRETKPTDRRLVFDLFLLSDASASLKCERQWCLLDGSFLGNWETIPSQPADDAENDTDRVAAERSDEQITIIELDTNMSQRESLTYSDVDRPGSRKRYRGADERLAHDDVLLIDP